MTLCKVISVEGNIGVGKSSVLIHLANSYNYNCLQEPVEEWTLLDRFYHDRKKYAVPLQFQILTSQFRQYQNFKKPLTIVERSPWTSKHVFAELLLEDDTIWLPIYNAIHKYFTYHVDHYIYLNVNPTIAHERIMKRRRGNEKNISIEYLQKLHDKYDNFFSRMPKERYTVIDASEPMNVVIFKINKTISHFLNN